MKTQDDKLAALFRRHVLPKIMDELAQVCTFERFRGLLGTIDGLTPEELIKRIEGLLVADTKALRELIGQALASKKGDAR